MFLVPSDYNTLIEFLVGAVVVSTYFAGKKVPYPKQISLSITNIWKILRNRYSGHKDPDAGTVATVYDALDRPVRRTDANGNTTVYSYDLAGRVLTAVHESGSDTETVTYTYDNAPGRGVGKLASVRHDNSLIYAIDERNKFREPFKCRFGNDTGTEYSYNAYGMLTGIKNGNLTVSGGTVNSGVTPGQGSLFYIVGGQYRKLTYAYNTRGFIGSKYDERTEQGESYTYDALDRLTSFTVNNVTAATFTYGNNGNITSNTKVGDYAYESGKPHAVTSIEGNLSCPIHLSQCDVEYNVRNMPSAIVENGYRILIDYDASGMRRHTEITAGNTLVKKKTRISSLFETEATPFSSRRLDYIYAEGRIVAVRVYANGSGSLYYVLTDHLGSWERVLDQSRNTIQQTHFDPWGNRMSFTAWNTPQTQTSFTFDRGFTGHEHYDSLHIINANARLYDPVIGRFFSPDPFVQAPDFTQAFNRYSYCMNNPVMYSDPDGELFGIDDAIIIGAMVGAFFGGIRADQKGESFVGGMIKGAFIGGLSGALGGIGGAGMSYAENLFLGVWEGGFTGYVDGLVWGEDPGKSMLYGMASGAIFTTLTSENLKNALKGYGFKTNANVFEDLKAGKYPLKSDSWQQDALNLFGFEGDYKPETNSITSPGSEYWGSTNRTTGDISYGNLAFEDYTSLYGTYLKESWSSHRIKAGLGIHEISEELKGMPYETYLEEIDGYVHVFKNQGLISYSAETIKYPFQGIEYYQTLLKLAGSSYSDYPSKYIGLYKIPRRW